MLNYKQASDWNYSFCPIFFRALEMSKAGVGNYFAWRATSSFRSWWTGGAGKRTPQMMFGPTFSRGNVSLLAERGSEAFSNQSRWQPSQLDKFLWRPARLNSSSSHMWPWGLGLPTWGLQHSCWRLWVWTVCPICWPHWVCTLLWRQLGSSSPPPQMPSPAQPFSAWLWFVSFYSRFSFLCSIVNSVFRVLTPANW